MSHPLRPTPHCPPHNSPLRSSGASHQNLCRCSHPQDRSLGWVCSEVTRIPPLSRFPMKNLSPNQLHLSPRVGSMVTLGGGSEDRLSRPRPLRKPQLATDRKRRREPIVENSPCRKNPPKLGGRLGPRCCPLMPFCGTAAQEGGTQGLIFWFSDFQET